MRRDAAPCNDNVPVISAPGSKRRSARLGAVPFSNNVLGTDMLLKQSRKKKSACTGVVLFSDKVKGTEELLRQRCRERERRLAMWHREQGNGTHLRALNKGKFDHTFGVPTKFKASGVAPARPKCLAFY